MLLGALLQQVGDVTEVRRRYRGSAIDYRHAVLTRELLNRDFGSLEVGSGLLIRSRMQRRHQEDHFDVARAKLFYERADDERARRRRRGLSHVLEETVGRGDQPRVIVDAPGGDPVPQTGLVVPLARGERSQPLLQQLPLAVGGPDLADARIDALTEIELGAEPGEIGGRHELAREIAVVKSRVTVDRPW